ncbi:hypothetical protein L0657_24730 [Dyadobacter sp. CY345]|uniref:hypothetical protein n=1 Tax=Dyadobacter sp. CY345 TaxID=2909335 RepID=UPI001F404B42|nr:hypothetical protein [Dyadobacter sp. CY345]MCF2447183.1 hypothetical protein [Dyadobacter sp. CY345]
MADFIKCKKENGFLIFDTIEKYPENIADDILDEFVKQDLEAIIYKTSGDPLFQVTGRIRESYVKLIHDEAGEDPVSNRTNVIKKALENTIQELVLNNLD